MWDFNPRAPCGARHQREEVYQRADGISTHAPLAGRDPQHWFYTEWIQHFNPRAPCGARPSRRLVTAAIRNFNPRAPCGARLFSPIPANTRDGISTHAPLAGRDVRRWTSRSGTRDFNPRAPCGARQQKCTNHYAHFCDNRQISDAFAQNAACQGILLLFDAGKPCGFWVRTAQVISAHLCFAL